MLKYKIKFLAITIKNSKYCFNLQGICPFEFACGDNMCIDKTFICDGELDCIDGSDEQQNCSKYFLC